MDGHTHDGHNAMTKARWPLASGAKNGLKLKYNPNNPIRKVVFELLYRDQFLEKDIVLTPFSLPCETDINCLNFGLEDEQNCKISEISLWTCKSPIYNYYLAFYT